MKHGKKVIRFAGVSGVALSAAIAASAQNLVVNGSFEGDNGLAGWSIGGTAGDGYLPLAIAYNQSSAYPTGAQGEAVPTDNAPSAGPNEPGLKGVYFVSDQANNLSVFQNVYLTPGTYKIGFDTYDTFNGAVQLNDAQLTAEIAGVQLANYTLSSISAGIWTTHSGLATISTAGYYPISFVFNTTMFPAKDVIIDQAYVIGASGDGTPVGAVTRLYWDGDLSGNANNGKVDGGLGTWTTTSPNFADQTGATNGAYYPQPGSVIFSGAPGVVTVDDSAGAVAVTGMQFAVDGYRLVGDTITLSDPNAVLQVGDGTSAGADYAASIAAALIGSGGLTKTDLGTLILSGQNSYSGDTNVNGGVLKGGAVNTFSAASALTVGASGTLDLGGFDQTVSALAGAGTVTNSGSAGATLTNQGVASTFSGVIRDGAASIGLTEASGATLTLTGANTYTGATTVNGGVLAAGAMNTFSPTSTIKVNAGGTVNLGGFTETVATLNLNGGSILAGGSCDSCTTVPYGQLNNTNITSTGGTIAAGVTGSGSFTNVSGTTVFSASPLSISVGTGSIVSYSGPTTITAGSIRANNLSALDSSSDYTVAAGATLDLGGYSQTIGSLSGAGSVTSTVASGNGTATLLLYDGNSTTFSGTISDGATPVALEIGNNAVHTLTLTGTNTYSGGTTWSQNNTISIDNSGALGTGPLMMFPGAILAFTGTGYTLANNAIFEQFGDPTIDSGSGVITMSGVISGTGSLTKVGAGTLILNGVNTFSGTTEVQVGQLTLGDHTTPGAQLAGDVQVDVGAVLAGFGTVMGDVVNNGTLDNNSELFVPTGLKIGHTYTQTSTGNLLVGVTPTAASLLAVAGTATLAGTVTFAYAPGTYVPVTLPFLTSAGLGGTTFTTLAVAPNSSVPTGLTQSVAYTASNANLVLTSNVPTPTPTPTPPVVVAPNDATIYSAETFAFSQGHLDAITGLLSRSLSDGGGNTFYNAASSHGPGVRTWAQVDGSTFEINRAGATANTTADTTGLQGGVDVQLGGEGRVGVAVGYDYQWLHDNAGGKALDNGVQVSLYGSQPLGPVGLSAVVSYAHGDDTVDRATGVGQARATRNLDDYAGAVQLSAPVEAVGLVVTPAAGVAVQRLTSNAFNENFARSEGFAVSGAARDLTSVSLYAVVGFSHTLITGDGVSVTPDVMLGYRYNSAGRGQDVTLVAADGTIFGGERTALSKNSGLIGASLTATRGGWTAFVKYRGDLADGWNDESVAVGMRVAF